MPQKYSVVSKQKRKQNRQERMGNLGEDPKFIISKNGIRYKRIPIFYRKWQALKQRCLNPDDKYYKYYGGRGIKVCKKWLKFKGFKKDMFPSFKLGLSIERINVNKGYTKSNCIWIPMPEQSKNRTNVKLYNFNGKKLNLLKISKIIGIGYSTLLYRIKKGKWNFKNVVKIKPSFHHRWVNHL